MSFHMLSYSLESPVSLSERGLDSFTPSPLDRRQLRSVMQKFFSFHLIMRHDEKYVYIYVSVIIIIIISNCGMSFSINSIILQLKPVLVHLQTILFLSKFSTVKDDI